MRIDRRSLLKLLPAAFLDLRQAAAIRPVAGRQRARDLGIRIGSMEPGRWNAITDVPGVRVGHSTILQGSGSLQVGTGPVRTGVTIVWPNETITEDYLPFGACILNGNGEVTGITQASALGVIGSPIATTTTSSVGNVYDALLSQLPPGFPLVPVVCETWDAFLNDDEGRHVRAEHVIEAMRNASDGPVAEGNVGGGTGMICYGFKGGIGTASRQVPVLHSHYTLGVLVQANHGRRKHLRIDGVPVGEEIRDLRPSPDRTLYMNSIIMIVATDAPLLDFQLERICRRAALGLAKTGSISSNSSGDFTLAFSTSNRIRKQDFWKGKTYSLRSIEQFHIQSLLEAASEATEEAIINALFMAEDMTGIDNHTVYALPIDRTLRIMERHHRLFVEKREKKIAAL